MAPIRSYAGWNTRSTNSFEQKEPYKHYYFICEGQNTERWYFEEFINLKKEFAISSLISIEYLEKTGEHKSWSNPKKLFELADEYIKDLGTSFDSDHDTVIVVFDADIYENEDDSDYTSLIQNRSNEYTICVTNPSFELFLLLHYENSYAELIHPNSEQILANNWVDIDDSRIRYMEYLFRQKSGLKPKRDSEISQLVRNVHVAISQERNLNNDIHLCHGKLTSNIGLVIQSIFDDKCDATN